jgi:uncharacterized protein
MSEAAGLFEAIRANDAHVVADLLRANPALAGAKGPHGLSSVMVALYGGRSEIAEIILKSGYKPDLFEASALGLLPLVEELIHKNPDQTNATSVDGFTPLTLASFFGHREVVDFLLSKGADPNTPAKNPMRVAPLHSAAAHTRPFVAFSIAKLLLMYGASANARQEGEWTALHQAAANGNLDLVALLLECGADPTARSSDGKTPVDLAIEKGQQKTADILNHHLRHRTS